MTQTSRNETVFTCARFSIYCNEQGKHMVDVPNGVGILAVNHDGHVLMTREYRPHLDRYVWRIPAGKCEDGEDFVQTAHRELREESGYDAKKMDLFWVYDLDIAVIDRQIAFFVARDLFIAPLDSGDEAIAPEVHFMSPSKVKALLKQGEIVGDVAAGLYRFLHIQDEQE